MDWEPMGARLVIEPGIACLMKGDMNGWAKAVAAAWNPARASMLAEARAEASSLVAVDAEAVNTQATRRDSNNVAAIELVVVTRNDGDNVAAPDVSLPIRAAAVTSVTVKQEANGNDAEAANMLKKEADKEGDKSDEMTFNEKTLG